MNLRFAALVPALLLAACASSSDNEGNILSSADSSLSMSDMAVTSVSGPDIVQAETVYGTQSGKQLKGYLALPADVQDAPALILIHEWWGLNDNMKDMAERFAREGYIALAVDLYGESTTDQARARELSSSVQNNLPAAFDNLEQAVAFLKNREDVDDDRIASVGWCFGGGWSYQMAKNDLGVKASVMYYGRFSAHDDLSHMKADIIGHFGEQDASIKVDDVKEFEATLRTQGGDHEVYIYPNAGHAFANGDNVEAYNAEAAEQAWTRTMVFLEEHLGSNTSSQ
jgi:carboxymethylenebutenolidase